MKKISYKNLKPGMKVVATTGEREAIGTVMDVLSSQFTVKPDDDTDVLKFFFYRGTQISKLKA